MVDIRPQDLNPAVTPIDADSPIIIDQGLAGVNRTTSTEMVNAVAPVVSQAEAEVGTDDVKRMTALKTKQSIASEVGVSVASYAAGQAGLSAVQSVNGKSGNAVTIVKGDVGLGNVDNTSDLDKPVSTATQAALNGKATVAQGNLADTALQAPGGAAGQFLAKNSAADNDVIWVTSESVTAVSYGPQSLTDAQQVQARQNIQADHAYDTIAIATAATVPAYANAIRTNGYQSAGDGGGALYKRVLNEPTHAGKFQSADGAWWELAESVIRPEMFGITTSSSLPELQAFFDFAAGKEVIMPRNVQYDIGGGTLWINGNDTAIKWRGCTIRRSANAETFGVMIMGNNVTFRGVMKYRCVGGDIMRGIAVGGHDFTYDTIDIEADTAGTGNGNHRRDAFCVGSQPYVVYRTKGKRVRIKNFEFCASARNAVDVDFGFLDIEVYRRGLYIDESSIIRATGHMKIGSPLNTNSAGENGVLIHSEANTTSENIYITDMVVEDSGEHGYRIAGTFAAKNIWHTNCTARRSGRAGFKSLGIETTIQENIFYDNCLVEDCGGNGISNANACGFQIEYSKKVQINNPIVRRAGHTRSCFDGIRITGCTDIQINNPMIEWCVEDGVRIDSSRGASSRVRLNGGLIHSNGRHGIYIQMSIAGQTFRDIDVAGFPLVHGNNVAGAGGYDFFVDMGASFPVGGMVQLQLKDTTAITANSGPLGGTLTSYTASIVGPYPVAGPVGIVRDGSTWQAGGSGFRIKKAGVWTLM